MKIVFLNALNAKVTEPLKLFLQTHAQDTDVFCFQECYKEMRALMNEVAPHYAIVRESKPVLHDSVFTNCTYVRSGLTVENSSSNVDTLNTGLSLFTTINFEGTPVHLANVHGLAKPGKLDNENRLQQSKELIYTFETQSGVKIIGGDLNVDITTESVALFEKARYQNLIRDFGIKTTRNEMAWSRYPGHELYYSDYVFVQGVEVTSFEVPKEIVSDHQPMILTVKI